MTEYLYVDIHLMVLMNIQKQGIFGKPDSLPEQHLVNI